MSLLRIPVEIMEEIGTHLSSSDISALMRASRRLYHNLKRSLYSLARHHRIDHSSDLTTGLQDVTFWFDKTCDLSVLEWAIVHGRTHTFEQLISEPTTDLVQADSYGVTLLHRLSGQGLVQYIKELIGRLQDVGCDPFDVDLSLLTPLHYAAGRGMTEAVDVLIAMGASVSAQDHHGNTPLHLAAVTGSHQVFAQLVQAGADVNSEGRFSWTPVDQASISHHESAVDELKKLGSRSPTWQQREHALNEFVRLSPCPLECYKYHADFTT